MRPTWSPRGHVGEWNPGARASLDRASDHHHVLFFISSVCHVVLSIISSSSSSSDVDRADPIIKDKGRLGCNGIYHMLVWVVGNRHQASRQDRPISLLLEIHPASAPGQTFASCVDGKRVFFQSLCPASFAKWDTRKRMKMRRTNTTSCLSKLFTRQMWWRDRAGSDWIGSDRNSLSQKAEG